MESNLFITPLETLNDWVGNATSATWDFQQQATATILDSWDHDSWFTSTNILWGLLTFLIAAVIYDQCMPPTDPFCDVYGLTI